MRSPAIVITDPLMIAVICMLAFVVVISYPLLQSRGVRVSMVKYASLLVVLSYCLYYQNLVPLAVFAFPLSLIWFPDFWGQYQGYLHRQYIDEPTHPIVVSICGWLLLTAFPAFWIWVLQAKM